MMQQLPQNNQCHKCHEWFGTVHVCAIDVKAALAKCCNQCDDGVRVLAAELATLREKAAMVDELRKDAEIAVTSIYIALDALNEIIEMDGQDNLGDAKREATKAMAQLAAIAHGKGE